MGRTTEEDRPAGRGVKLIKTALFDLRKPACLESMHWYLAAPFARSLMEIVNFNKKG